MWSLRAFSFHRPMRVAELLSLLLLLAAVSSLDAQSTRPERTGYRETSSYQDVLTFLDSLQMVTEEVRIGTLGVSPEGRRIP